MNELFLLFESGVVIKLSLSHAVSITLDRQKTLLGLTLTENSRAQNNSCISLKSRNGACGEIRTRDSLLKRQVLYRLSYTRIKEWALRKSPLKTERKGVKLRQQ